MDGATARLAIAPDVLREDGFDDPAAPPLNVLRFERSDASRFELMPAGEEVSGLRRASVGERLGAREDLWGSTTYVMPRQMNLEPVPYITLQLRHVGYGRTNRHTAGPTGSRNIFAKLVISAPYVNTRSQLMETTFSAPRDVDRIGIELTLPDGTPLRTHGRDHSLTFHFVSEQPRPAHEA